MATIYCLHNTRNGKLYVGQTSQTVEHRMSAHKCVGRARERGFVISSAIRKYGWAAFRVIVLEEVDAIDLDEAEAFWIAYLQTETRFGGYNVSRGGHRTKSLTPEMKARISASLKGRLKSAETRERIRAARLGVPRSEASKLKQSISMLGRTSASFKHKPNSGCFRKGCVSTTKGRIAIVIDGRVRKLPPHLIDPYFVDVSEDFQ